MDWISKLMEAAKVPTKIILCVFIVASALIILPDSTLTGLRIKEFMDKHGIYVGITALSSGALLVINLIIYVWKTSKNKLAKNRLIQKATERLQKLDHAEKAVLREFFLQGQNTIKLPIDHAVVAGLLESGILIIVGRHGRMSLAGMLMSMKISDHIDMLVTPELLDLPRNAPTQTEIDFIKSNRPSFMTSIEREESFLKW